jgi:hypothetical protein
MGVDSPKSLHCVRLHPFDLFVVASGIWFQKHPTCQEPHQLPSLVFMLLSFGCSIRHYFNKDYHFVHICYFYVYFVLLLIFSCFCFKDCLIPCLLLSYFLEIHLSIHCSYFTITFHFINACCTLMSLPSLTFLYLNSRGLMFNP